MKKGVVNALTVKKESQQKPSISHTSVRMKRQHGITSSDVNNLSRLPTTVSSKVLIVFVFNRQVVKSGTTFKEEVILLLKYSQFLLKTRINQSNRDVTEIQFVYKRMLKKLIICKNKNKNKNKTQNSPEKWKLLKIVPLSAIWSYIFFIRCFPFFLFK